MRTTIELSDGQRAKLLELAAERGEKGFSRLVGQAIELFLAEEGPRRERIAAALAAGGTLDAKTADSLEDSVGRARASWR